MAIQVFIMITDDGRVHIPLREVLGVFSNPDIAELIAVAKEVGLTISKDETPAYRDYVIDQMNAIDAFVQPHMEETGRRR
jgi:hypothetical protein